MLGIFDSGIGGFTVLRELRRRFPQVPFLYVGDTARTPYGSKSHETIIRYAEEVAEYLIERGATTLVVACNTVSAHALDVLRSRFSAVPIIDVIGPAVREAVSVTRGRIGVIGTVATIRSDVYRLGIVAMDSAIDVYSAACPLFVSLVEEGWLENEVTHAAIARYLEPLRMWNVDTLILGCTHYPFLETAIRSYIGDEVTIIQTPKAVIDELERCVPNECKGSGMQRYELTDDPEPVQRTVDSWMRSTVPLIRTHI